MVLINGSQVVLGDNIFIHRAAASGQVVKVQEHSVTVRVQKDGGHRDFTVQSGGVVAGEIGASWFPPIAVPYSKADNAKYVKAQAIIAAVLENL